MAFDVVIAGGGFGGLYAARRLERRLPRYSARIIVVSDVIGQLGHPPSLETYLDEARHTDEAPRR